MSINVQNEIFSDDKLHKYLHENSYWYKYLNRSDAYLKKYKTFIKKKYKLGALNKIENGINTIDLVSNIIQNI